MAQDPYKYFRPEARDLVDQLAKGVLELEKGAGGAGAVQKLLRVAHTLKGAARVVKQAEIAERAHALEDAIQPYRDRAEGIAREEIDAILAHLDDISSRLDALGSPQAQPPEQQQDTDQQKKREPQEGQRTLRADIAETDAVLDGVAEAHTLLGGLRGAARGLEQARRLAELLMAQLAPAPAAVAGGTRQASAAQSRRAALAQELGLKCAGLGRTLEAAIDQMDRELHQLREAAEGLRLVAAGTLFTALERTARDAARALGRKVAFESRGGDIRLDGQVLETVQGALIQMVRNAVAHGIESPRERSAAGKPATGTIAVDVSRRGGRIVFACRDDGRGIDVEAVRRVAGKRGLLGHATSDLDAEGLVRILLNGGISTAEAVTDVSGRGVGLDVVRECAERLGGEVVLHSERGLGTTIELVIPLSLASMDALIVEAGGVDGTVSVAGIPLDAVRSTLRVAASDIALGSPGDTIIFQDKAIPFIPLATVLDGAPWSERRTWITLVVAGAEGPVAFGVDRLLGTSRIVARPLPQHMTASPVVTGAWLDGDGNPQLVLDPQVLAGAALRGAPVRCEAPRAARRILVVDDSLTTRMLEQSILEAAGYEVDVAASAEEALEILDDRSYALILVDVEMPGMDGFAFVERLRGDPRLRDTSTILVTSRASPEDMERGRAVGADGHIVKSEFDQADLLERIGRLVG